MTISLAIDMTDDIQTIETIIIFIHTKMTRITRDNMTEETEIEHIQTPIKKGTKKMAVLHKEKTIEGTTLTTEEIILRIQETISAIDMITMIEPITLVGQIMAVKVTIGITEVGEII